MPVGVDISLDSIAVDGTEGVASGGAEGGAVMVAVGEADGADIALDGGAVTMAVDGTGRAACGGGQEYEFVYGPWGTCESLVSFLQNDLWFSHVCSC